VAHGKLNETLSGARAAVAARRLGDGEGQWLPKACGGGTLRCGRDGKEDGVGEVR
jgi:hypothetical protein